MTARLVREDIKIEVKEIKLPLYKKEKRLYRIINKLTDKMRLKKFKRFILGAFSAYFLLFGNVNAVTAYEMPSAPVAPTAPPAPVVTETPPPAPTAPPAPSVNEATATPTPTPTPTVSEVSTNTNTSGQTGTDEDNANTGITGETQNNTTGSSTGTTGPTNESGSGNQEQNGTTSGAIIDTGNSTNTAVVATDANNNLSAGVGSTSGGSGATIKNEGNGTGSENTGSATITENSNTNQTNSANVTNNLNQTTTTGDNSASRNTNGDNTITTGDANTSGTAITSVNTNLEGLAVYEFNIAEDQNGDYILDFANATCISGCAGSTNITNSGNGSDSTNTGELDSTVNNNTFQNNDATVENNLTLASNSGDNETSRNTGGDNSILTGDANVSANAITLANNNISGGVVYAVVNIYGNLVGDIILPDGTVIPCCFGGETTLSNTDNGSGSSNTANSSETVNNNLNQFNNAEIDNNLSLYANTGGNDVSKNTGGNNTIESGDTNVVANVVNFVNNNIVGGNWWLVIVNEGGKWIGKIFGAPEGSNMYGSEGFEITTDEYGQVNVTNSGNGSDSTNTGSVNQTTNNNTDQVNNAHIVNNLNLSANTGGNDASRNTNGSNSIVTGDANIIANIVNFVNNNIVGTGKLLVTVVNVFGEWLGNFYGPGQEKVAESNSDNHAIGGQSVSNDIHEENNSSDNNNEVQGSIFTPLKNNKTAGTKYSGTYMNSKVAGISINSSDEGEGETELVAVAGEKLDGGNTAGKKVVKINLAWLTLLIPFGAAYIISRKRKLALAKTTASKAA